MIRRYSLAVSLPRSLIGTANLVLVVENGLAVERTARRLARMMERAEDILVVFVSRLCREKVEMRVVVELFNGTSNG